jgi:hypothetical protein
MDPIPGARTEMLGSWRTSTAMDVVSRLRVGMTREEVVAVLGEPDDVSTLSRKHRIPAIYKYGDIELYFEPLISGKLWMVYTEVETQEGERQGVVLLR